MECSVGYVLFFVFGDKNKPQTSVTDKQGFFKTKITKPAFRMECRLYHGYLQRKDGQQSVTEISLFFL